MDNNNLEQNNQKRSHKKAFFFVLIVILILAVVAGVLLKNKYALSSQEQSQSSSETDIQKILDAIGASSSTTITSAEREQIINSIKSNPNYAAPSAQDIHTITNEIQAHN